MDRRSTPRLFVDLQPLALYWDNGKENGNYMDYRGHKGYTGMLG